MTDESSRAPAPPGAPRPAPGSMASRYFFMLLIGLFAGAMGVVMVLRAIEARKTWEDRFPHAAMQVMTAHAARLKGTVAANRCGAADILPHVQALRVLANDLEPAFPGLEDDARFSGHAVRMRVTLDQVLESPPTACPDAEAALVEINRACRACHQDFRG